MPIPIDRFEDADALGDPSTGERVLQFLLAHPDEAYARREIADAIDLAPGTVGTALTRLKDRGLVRHRAPYWALTDDRERVLAALDAGRRGDADSGVRGESESGDDVDGGAPPAESAAGGPHRAAAAAFFERVRERVDGVEALYLFGSVARGAERPTSDVDVLAVVADDADYAAVDDRLLDVAYDVQLTHGVPVEVHAVRASEFAARAERGDPFVRAVLEEDEAGG